MASLWKQQALALDAKYNAHRAPNIPHFKTLYLRRRSQLLREHRGEDTGIRKQYLKLRSQLLQQRYGVLYDQCSIKSRSVSARSSSRVSESPENSRCFSDSVFESEDSNGVVPTFLAEASKAIVGGTTTAENYAFVGVHYIFDQHSAAVTMVKFANNDRSLLCCASFDGSLSICNVTSSPPKVEFFCKGHEKAVTGCDWSASNDLIVTSSLDGTICLWEVSSGKCLRTVRNQMGIEITSCLFQPANNNMVIAGNSKGIVEVLNVSTGIYPRGGTSKIGGKILALACDSSGQVFWAGNDKGVLISHTFDLATGKLTKNKKVVIVPDCPITCISWRAWMSREARDPTLLINCAANVVCLFRVIDNEGNLQLRRKFSVRHKTYLLRSTFCPIISFREGACVVSGSEDACVYFFDIEREKPCVNKLQGHACPVLGVSFNYDESLLATSDYQGLVIVWKRERHKTNTSP